MNDPLSIKIQNRTEFEKGNDLGEWLKLPATAEQLQEAMRQVGITENNLQDFFINGIDSPIEAVARLSLENLQTAGIDELNYLAAQLKPLDRLQIDKLNAAGEVMSYWDSVHHLIEYTHNTDFFVHIPSVYNHVQLGEYYLEETEMIKMPDEWIGAINIEMLGELAAAHEKGIFTEQGYILESGDKWQPVHEIPEQYKIMSFPQSEQTQDSVESFANDFSQTMQEFYQWHPSSVETFEMANTSPNFIAHQIEIGHTSMYLDEALNKLETYLDFADIAREYRQRLETIRPPQQNHDDPNIDYETAPTADITPPIAVEPLPVKSIELASGNPADKLKEITDKLENGITDIFESEHYQNYLNTLSKFHNYSLNNTILIAMQKPDASRIAGYNAWKNNFERQVKKGEKGIKILAPAPFIVKKEMDKIDPATQRPIVGQDGKTVTEEIEVKIPAFKVVSVFDLSQTEGKELPSIATALTGDVEQYNDFFAALEKTSPFSIEFEPLKSDTKGYANYAEKRIAIQEGMSEFHIIKTAIHEIAHAKLHDTTRNDPAEEIRQVDSRTREVEAESIAFTVCAHYGLDTSDYSFGYVASWSSDKELSELKSSLETIRTTAAELISEIDGHFAELSHDREQTTEIETPPVELEQPQSVEVAEPLQSQNKDVEEIPLSENPLTEPQTEDNTPPTDEPTAPYFDINEQAARRAKEANSFSDYKPGSATAEYKQSVDEAFLIGEQQKSRVDPMYHEKIDRLVNTYARKLAENMNNSASIESRVPSIMITGPSNFPTRKKEQQNNARYKNMEEWRDIQGLLDKIRSTGMGGISADDPNAIGKLQEKLAGLEKLQEDMKATNAYFRKNKTLDGCPNISVELAQELTADMQSRYYGRVATKPFESYLLQNNNAEINRLKGRITELTHKQEAVYAGWQFDGGKVEPNQKDNRLQIFFDEKPDEDTRKELKSNGFRWAPSANAWQRQLNNNAYRATNYIKSIQPITGEKPTDLQRRAYSEAKQQPEPQGDFSICQLKQDDSTRDFRFEPLEQLQKSGLTVDPKNYELVYTAPISTDTASLKQIFEKFNMNHPEDFTGHSLSVSDIVTLNRDGEETAHYVDSVGFQDVPEFLNPAPELEPNQHIKNIDGVDFVYTTVTPTEPEKSQDNRFETKSAVHSNYKDMVALMDKDRNVYLGKSENYHFITNFVMPWNKPTQEYGNDPSYYDNSDNSLVFISDNPKMYSFISSSGWVKSQADMISENAFSQADYDEFARLQSGTLKDFPYKDNFTGIHFDGQPFDPSLDNPLKNAEMSEEQNYNMIDGIPNNRPSVDELEAKVNAGETISLFDLAKAIKEDKATQPDTDKKPSIRAQLKADKHKSHKSKADRPRDKSTELEV